YSLNRSSTPDKVIGIIPKGNLRIPICHGNVRGTSASDALHVASPGPGVLNPMLCLESRLVAIVDLLQMLLDARIDFWPALGFYVRLQVKPGAPLYAPSGPGAKKGSASATP
ncbi:hypothetical protein Tco_0208669, partial [Tanacetum coccineum]